MTEKPDIAKLYREFEEALTDFVSASLSVDDDPAVVLPRRAGWLRRASAYARIPISSKQNTTASSSKHGI